MSSQIIIIILTLLSIIGIGIWFYNERNVLGRLHHQKITRLEYAIHINQSQIGRRCSSLNRYDFEKYNLDEALVAQREIII